MAEFFTWQYLATMAGASLATAILTQLAKDVFTIPTQCLSYCVALVILLLATFFTGATSLDAYAICMLNAAVVASTASNAVSLIQRMNVKE